MRFQPNHAARLLVASVIVIGLLGAQAFTSVAPSGRPGAATEAKETAAPTPPAAATVTSISASWGIETYTLTGSARADLPWEGVNTFAITLSSPAPLGPSDVTVTGMAVANYGPVAISGSGTSYRITLGQPVNRADVVTVTVGNAGISTFTTTVKILPGDINGDGVVNATDLVLARNALTAAYNLFADINGDGAVNITDYNLVRINVGVNLP